MIAKKKHVMAHDVSAYSFRPGPGKEWRTAIEDIEDGITIGGMFTVLRSSNRRRVGLHAREGRHSSVSRFPPPSTFSLSPRI